MTMRVAVTVNGTEYARDVEPRLLLIHFLRGKAATEENFAQAATIAAGHCHPVPDQRGPEDYKRHLVAELTTRALRRAAQRARERATA